MPPTRILGVVAALAFVIVDAAAAGASNTSSFDRFCDVWKKLQDYSVTIDAHETLGDRSADNVMLYRFRKPDRARLDVIAGPKSGATIVWTGTDKVTAYKRGLSFFKMHGDAHQVDLTSLRGNGILDPNMGTLVACFEAHRDALVERAGPTIDGKATTEIALPYKGIVCPEDSASDRGVITLDVLDVADASGLVLVRKRYEGDEVVERWALTNYVIDAGLTDADLR